MARHGGNYYEKYSRLEQRQARMRLLSYFLLAGLALVTIPVVLLALNR